MKFGLNKNELRSIKEVLFNYKDFIDEVILYGSRARGTYKDTSDVDLAIKFHSGSDCLNKIIRDFIESKIIYTFDIINYHAVTNSKLKYNIDREGIVFYKTNGKGELLVNLSELEYKLETLEKVIKKLHESSKRDYHEDDIVLDATIQRFEFSFELSWKMMKAYLEYEGLAETSSPRATIREAFKQGLVKEGHIWLDMLVDRNRTVHTYDEEIAISIYEQINDLYLSQFDDLCKVLNNRICVNNCG